ncbi:MAG: pyrroline-5-carboxylate reductase [Clostridia bacterium]|nr:pyrroline-5-carboxylate reductase [Clostridia bacterium]
MKYTLGIIGVGTMGSAILNGISNNYINNKEILLYDINPDIKNKFNSFSFANSEQEILDNCKYVLLSIKPQQFDNLAVTLKPNKENIFISIMAGIKISKIQTMLRINNNPVFRIMPNTPCKIGQGICSICFNNYITEESKLFVKNIFMTCGNIIEIEEEKFDTVTSISGSGPAYIFYFIRSMIESGIKNGLTFEQSRELTINTFIGATKLYEQSNEDLNILIDKVCSKGGTTIQAINTFNENNLDLIIKDGIDRCKKRSEELSK